MTSGSDGPNGNVISNPLEIGGLLHSLANRRDILTVECGDLQFTTHILNIDIAARTFVINRNTNQIEDETVAKSDSSIFHAMPRGVRFEFLVERMHPVVLGGKPAFQTSFPSTLLYLQRREYFRVRTPVINPYLCIGSLPNGERFRAEIVDLSVSGVALRMMDDHIGELKMGSTLHAAELHFTGQSPVALDLQFVSNRSSDSVGDGSRSILGFKFISLPGPAENVLLRLIARLELERRSICDDAQLDANRADAIASMVLYE
jgi:c-di-GMP-binding flagellar brake protein YcgR